MQPTDIGWRQVRIFTSDFSAKGYFGLLTTFAKAFAEKYPETPFWFSRYALRVGVDDADTDISALPPTFLHPLDLHFSIRFRFRPAGDEEIFLESLFGPTFWRSDFRIYDVLGELGSERFCPNPDLQNRLRRVALLSRLLHSHCLFLLDTIGPDSTFEVNGHEQNHFYKSTFLSTLHLFNNVVGQSGGEGFNLYALDKPLTGTDLKYVSI
ncbi:MAG: hypothetical protein V4675_09285 [Verrucomicrobiota bacterium]